MRWPWPAAAASAAVVSVSAHRTEPVFPATDAFDAGGTGCGGGYVAASVVSGNVAPAAHRLAGRGADDIGRAVAPRSTVGGRWWRPLGLWSAPCEGWRGCCSRHRRHSGGDGEDAAADTVAVAVALLL